MRRGYRVGSVRRSPAAAVVLAAMALLPVAAFAHRPATRTERSAVVAAAVRQRQLSPAQGRCQVVTISTVNTGYATLSWPRRLSRACQRVAANGVIIEHRTSRGWRLVAVGSEFQCPIKGVPRAVARDLDVCQ